MKFDKPILSLEAGEVNLSGQALKDCLSKVKIIELGKNYGFIRKKRD